jgi:hypothetical protein
MNWLIFLALTLPGVLVAYVLFVRPVLHAMPTFQRFYAEADGFWQKVWALCGRSVTLAFAYIIQAISWLLQWIDPIASFLGDPDFRQQLTDALQANPKLLGWVLMAISAMTIYVRVRALIPKGDG